MNHTTQFRTTLPHQLHQTQCQPLQTFTTTARFPATTLDSLNAVMIPTITPDETGQYHGQMATFITEARPEEQQHIKEEPAQLGNTNGECDRNDTNNCPTTSAQTAGDFGQNVCNHGIKSNCIQCFDKPEIETTQTNVRNKIMVDAATMTDNEEMDLTSNWQNVSVPANTKVAEYLTSLRQFLKLSTPGSEGKRKLGDVRIVTSADGSRLYCCPECQMAYPDKNLLEPHLASHKIERRFVCAVCGAGLKRKEHLDRHQLSHTDDRPYSCAACPKTFKRNEHLARHYIIHSGEKAQMDRRFVCGVCGLGHARREQLERHQLSHSQERKHVCPACQKRFKRNEHLARHVITHSGLKPHGCLECGKAFYRKDHLRKHLLAHETKRIRLAAGLITPGGGNSANITNSSNSTLSGETISEIKSLSLSLPTS
ncbi:hypothetical protein O3M35_006272 [Rhynocoris fuscipes]|uniref:C2H2-type domain-containing protein n=1 Tax=Rhynocoris fuscipes TaxID=488301 RepID=A0AAW1DFG6_9HEMI